MPPGLTARLQHMESPPFQNLSSSVSWWGAHFAWCVPKEWMWAIKQCRRECSCPCQLLNRIPKTATYQSKCCQNIPVFWHCFAPVKSVGKVKQNNWMSSFNLCIYIDKMQTGKPASHTPELAFWQVDLLKFKVISVFGEEKQIYYKFVCKFICM